MSEDPVNPGPMSEGPAVRPEPAAVAKARRSRSIAMALGLIAFVLLVFIVTILKLSHHAA